MNATQPHRKRRHLEVRSAVPVRDAGGAAIFSSGDVGAVHAMAHRMFDEGRITEGHRRLGAWLEDRRGAGSDWVHIQFHMAVFELELGLRRAAHARFIEHVLPAAAATSDALTDAPALAWRLWLSSGSPKAFPWEPIRRRAVTRLLRNDNAFVDLHNVLALAGAGDFANLARWFDSRRRRARTRPERLVLAAARALAAFAEGDFPSAAEGLAELRPQIPQIGGSRAQNRLFEQIELAARSRIGAGERRVFLADVA